MKVLSLLILIIVTSSTFAGVTLKKLTPKQYQRWVIPPLREIVQSYQKTFIKIDPKLKEAINFIPFRQNLIDKFRVLKKECQKQKPNQCASLIGKFHQTIQPYHDYWKSQISSDTTHGAYKITSDLTSLITMSSKPNVGEKKLTLPSIDKLMSLYIMPYPYLLSKITIRRKDMNKLWGHITSPIIKHLLYRYNFKFLKSRIDNMNLELNEVRMIWTRRQKVNWNLQRSINYMHSQWNLMLKSTLKF